MNSDKGLSDSPLDYAVKEYKRLFEEARLGQRPWDRDATLRALAEKTGVTVEELQKVLPAGA